jgi:hypothetical protein
LLAVSHQTAKSAECEALRRELQEKERARADMAVELTLARKNEWGSA